MNKPYYYRIKDKETGIYYSGSRRAKDCHPSEFWVTYFTSSKIIHEIVEEYGKDRFEVQRVIPKKDAIGYETKVLRRLDCRNHPLFYNQHNNDGPTFGDSDSVVKMTETRNSKEWNETVGVTWRENIKRTLRKRVSQEDWDIIDKERREKISRWNNDSDNQAKRVVTMKRTLASEEYQTKVEPQRVQKVIESSKRDSQRPIVLEIRSLLGSLKQPQRIELVRALGIKQGWYRKKEEELTIIKQEIQNYLDAR